MQKQAVSDPYRVLGVSRTASAAELKKAFHKLAKQYHPDVNPNRSDIDQKFKEVNAAYELLSDPAKRARYDRGEIDAEGHEKGFAGGGDPFRDYAARARGGSADFGFAGGRAGFSSSGFAAEDLFSELFGGAQRRAAGTGHDMSGGSASGDVNYTLTVPLPEAALGVKRRLALQNGKTIDVTIPPGTEDGQKLRLRGLGQQSRSGAIQGDAIVEIKIEPHPYFSLKGSDIHLELPVSLQEAVLGATVNVPTLSGKVALKIPRGSNSGSVLRLKGKGVYNAKAKITGDQYVKLLVALPDPPDEDLARMVEKWAKNRTDDPRRKAGFD